MKTQRGYFNPSREKKRTRATAIITSVLIATSFTCAEKDNHKSAASSFPSLEKEHPPDAGKPTHRDKVDGVDGGEIAGGRTPDPIPEGTTPPGTSSIAFNSFDPLPENERAIVWGSKEDPPAKTLMATKEDLKGRHYLASDEKHPENYYMAIKDLGGGYIGVGTDQGYLFIGWMKPRLAWLTDYDQWVVLLHKVYFAFFEAAQSPRKFIRLWNNKKYHKSLIILKEKYKHDKDKDSIVRVFEESRFNVIRRLGRLRNLMDQKRIPSFVNDQATYDFVRTLVASHRVRPMSGNLLAKDGLLGIGKTAKQLGVPIRVLYLSNAEDYWSYPSQFRENMFGLHFDEKSQILRASSTNKKNDDYCYFTQSALNFIEWLRQPYIKRSRDIWIFCRVKSEKHFPLVDLTKPPIPPEY
jgi:hypothetical protein